MSAMKLGLWTSTYKGLPELTRSLHLAGIELQYVYFEGLYAAAVSAKEIAELGCSCFANCDEISADADYVLLYNYGKIITSAQLASQKFLNVHNSLLPKYRGLHAIAWAIINGEQEVGYSIHEVVAKVDAGDLLSQLQIPVGSGETSHDVFKRADAIVPQWVAETIAGLATGHYSFVKQNDAEATYVRRRKKEDGQIDWTQSSLRIHNLIRALAPPYTPGAYTYYRKQELIITEATAIDSVEYLADCGQIVDRFEDQGVLVKCGDGLIAIKGVIFAGSTMRPYGLFSASGSILGAAPDSP